MIELRPEAAGYGSPGRRPPPLGAIRMPAVEGPPPNAGRTPPPTRDMAWAGLLHPEILEETASPAPPPTEQPAPLRGLLPIAAIVAVGLALDHWWR